MDALADDNVGVDKSTLRALMQKRDGPGVVRISVQLTWFAVSMAAAMLWAASDNPLRWPAVVSAGLALSTLFPPQHETGHGTAFQSKRLNSAVAWLCAVSMLQCPSFFREFHWEHHRKTQNREEDPEIAAAPGILDGWPGNPLTYLALVSGLHLLVAKVMFTVSCAVPLTDGLWTRLHPYIRKRNRARIAWESRVVTVLLAGTVTAGVLMVPGFVFALLAWPISHLVLGFYLMPEHTGLPNDGSQRHRTRTIRSNALVRWLMWNMPYHVEHHVHPAIPFHAVPSLHREMASNLEHIESGYLAFHAKALGHAFWLRRLDK